MCQQQEDYYQQNEYPLADSIDQYYKSNWFFDDNTCTTGHLTQDSQSQCPLLLTTSFLPPSANDETTYSDSANRYYHQYATAPAMMMESSTTTSSNCTSPSSFFTSPLAGVDDSSYVIDEDFSYDNLDAAILLQAITIMTAPLECTPAIILPSHQKENRYTMSQEEEQPLSTFKNNSKSTAFYTPPSPQQQKQIQQHNKLFSCNSCSRLFARKHDLQRHDRVHSGEKPYSCLNCSKSFARTDALKRHLRVEDKCRLSPVIQAMKETGNRRYRNL